MLAENLRVGRGKRGFGVWLGDRLAGYVDFDPDNRDGLDPGDVNIAYAVHPWARGRGVAALAVELLCGRLQAERLGTAAALRIEPENTASIRVAEKRGFAFIREFESTTDFHADGRPVSMLLYRRLLWKPPSTSRSRDPLLAGRASMSPASENTTITEMLFG